jgi:hypothetical protein
MLKRSFGMEYCGEFTIETGKPVLLKEVGVIKDDLFSPIGESSGFLVNDRR